jgi:hypothetical protein
MNVERVGESVALPSWIRAVLGDETRVARIEWNASQVFANQNVPIKVLPGHGI